MEFRIFVDDDLLLAAHELTGIEGTKELIREALKALIERESARRLALLGGTMPGLKRVRRRRSQQQG